MLQALTGLPLDGRCQEGGILDADAVDPLAELDFVVPAGDHHHGDGPGCDGFITVFEGITGVFQGDEERVRTGHGEALSRQGADNRMDLLAELFADGLRGVLGGQAHARSADEGRTAILGIEAVNPAADAEEVGAERHVVALALGQPDVGPVQEDGQGIGGVVELDARAGDMAVQVGAREVIQVQVGEEDHAGNGGIYGSAGGHSLRQEVVDDIQVGVGFEVDAEEGIVAQDVFAEAGTGQVDAGHVQVDPVEGHAEFAIAVGLGVDFRGQAPAVVESGPGERGLGDGDFRHQFGKGLFSRNVPAIAEGCQRNLCVGLEFLEVRQDGGTEEGGDVGDFAVVNQGFGADVGAVGTEFYVSFTRELDGGCLEVKVADGDGGEPFFGEGNAGLQFDG